MTLAPAAPYRGRTRVLDDRWWPLLVSTAAFGAALIGAWLRPVWHDELFTLHVARLEPAAIIDVALDPLVGPGRAAAEGEGAALSAWVAVYAVVPAVLAVLNVVVPAGGNPRRAVLRRARQDAGHAVQQRGAGPRRPADLGLDPARPRRTRPLRLLHRADPVRSLNPRRRLCY